MYKCSSEKQVQREKHCGSWETNFILRLKEQETRLILHEHDDYDEDDDND